MNVEDIIARAPRGATEKALAAYLDQACGPDAELRAQVVTALFATTNERMHAEAGAVCSDVTVVDDTQLVPEERLGEVIGNYKLVAKLGEGGFGMVYLAEQSSPVKRRVALKIIKLGMDTKEVVARFAVERQVLAALDHPNIAKVHDAGATDAGRPYFVMEHVEGVPITQFCHDQRLNLSRRLALFKVVCRAVEHAHQNGIIHRDLKPTNVLVSLQGDEPCPKVIDFGVAKTLHANPTELTLCTQEGHVIGTPAYMSPEQVSNSALGIDTRSDVYSLGVLLYELVTGLPPFDPRALFESGYDEMRRVICEDEPKKPSTRLEHLSKGKLAVLALGHGQDTKTFLHALTGELDWLVMKAIDKDRARRYATADAFARDIERYFNQEPLEAAAPSVTYKMGKFVRRHKRGVSVASVMTLILITATAISIGQVLRTTTARTKAEELFKLSENRRHYAEGLENFLTRLFESPSPHEDGRQVKVADLLHRAATLAATDKIEDPHLYERLARSYLALGEAKQALPLAEQAQQFTVANSGPESVHARAITGLLARVLHAVGRREEAIALLEQLVVECRRDLGPDHVLTVNSMANLSIYQGIAGRQNTSRELLEQAIAADRQLVSDSTIRTDPADALGKKMNLGISYTAEGRHDHALAVFEDVYAESVERFGPDKPISLKALFNLAVSLHQLGDLKGAREKLEEALAISQELYGEDNTETLRVRFALAQAQFGIGEAGKALEVHAQVLERRNDLLGPTHLDTIKARSFMAILLHENGKLQEAVTMQEEALAQFREQLPPESPSLDNAQSVLAAFYMELDRFEDALELMTKISDQRVDLPADVALPEVAPMKIAHGLAVAFHYRRQFAQSLDAYRKILALSQAYPEADKAEAAALGRTLGETLARLGDWSNAEPYYDAIVEFSPSQSASHDWMQRGALCIRLGDTAAHEAHCREFITKYLDSEDPNEIERAVKTFLLSPSSPSSDLWPTVRAAARRIADREPTNGYYAMADGLARYRQGRFSEAITVLKRSSIAGSSAIKAMAAHQLGQRSDALQFLRKARRDPLVEFDGSMDLTPGWVDRLIPQLLLEEAELLISGMDCPSLEEQYLGLMRENVKTEAQLTDMVWKPTTPERVELPNSASGEKATFYTVNETDQVLALHWVPFDGGAHRFYENIEPGRFHRQESNVRSVWVIMSKEGDQLGHFVINKPWCRVVIPGSEGVHYEESVAVLREVLGEARARNGGSLGDLVPSPPLLPPTAEWKWLHPTDNVDPSETDPDFHTTFFRADFDDSKWQTGRDRDASDGGFGYGDSDFHGVDILEPSDPSKAYTSYFRCAFETKEVVSNLELRCQRDDGIIVYLNGKEVARDNMSAGNDAYRLLATETISGSAEASVLSLSIPGTLRQGPHILAISVHNATPSSSDLRLARVSLVAR